MNRQKKLLIALDFDFTYTADGECFLEIISVFQKFGHRVYIVTARSEEHDQYHGDDFPMLKELGVDTIFCDGKAKQEYTESLGLIFDIWIDDSPEGIVSGSSFTPRQLEEWRKEKRAVV